MSNEYPTDCVIWPGKLDRDGYGCLLVGDNRRAHRALYSMFVGPIPPGMCVLHSCDTPACVNPAHLRIGTQIDNMRDRDARRRTPRGHLNGNSKLIPDQVARIRNGLPCAQAMSEFGIGRSTYYRVRSYEGYKAMPPA